MADATGGSDAELDTAGQRPPPPAGSTILCERFADGVTIQVPAAGLWKGSKGLFVFALLWNSVVALVSFCLVGGVLGANRNNQMGDGWWVLPLMGLLFWGVGIGILLAAINMGRRRAALAVTGGSLMVLQTGLLGSKRRLWEPGEVEDVRTGPSGMKINDVPVLELQIFDGGGKLGLLSGRSDEELEWLAGELRSALQVGRQ